MTHLVPDQLAIHQQACSDLQAGRPLLALRAWRQMLTHEPQRIRNHLRHVQQHLDRDPLAAPKREAIALLENLLVHEPGETEQSQLGAVLLLLGQQSLQELPPQAQLRFEQAWACSRLPEAADALAAFYVRQGLREGAFALGDPCRATPLPPWTPLACFPGSCQPCQQQLGTAATPLPQVPSQPAAGLSAIAGGSIWVQQHTNPWRLSHGIGCVDSHDEPLLEHCRLYPWPWATCPHSASFAAANWKRLRHHRTALGAPRRLTGTVLAVADLSAELYFHWLLETLPRLGIAWQHLQPSPSPIWVWHNGSNLPRTREACQRLGIPAERILHASTHPWIQADTLLVPAFFPFGAVSSEQLSWLEVFWSTAATRDQPIELTRYHYLSRGATNRRGVLGEPKLIQHLQKRHLTLQVFGDDQPCANQLNALASAELVIAPHGGAMANLLAIPEACEVVELVNPAYEPPYFSSLISYRKGLHRHVRGLPTPIPLQELLYEGAPSYPIELDPTKYHQILTKAGLGG